MIHPIPPGTRDVLPDEMRELRRLAAARCADVFERFGYGEVATPTIEYDEVLARGDERGAPAAYRFFDESGDAARAALRHDDPDRAPGRDAASPAPSRRSASATSRNAYRAVRPQRGQMREFTQAGVELIGADGAGRHRRGDRGARARRSTRPASTAP